jgi:hypothetical protein
MNKKEATAVREMVLDTIYETMEFFDYKPFDATFILERLLPKLYDLAEGKFGEDEINYYASMDSYQQNLLAEIIEDIKEDEEGEEWKRGGKFE